MKLTRNNYEEYFILYMDNELTSEERRQVEAFVQVHPDLKEELDQLLLFKLLPDTTITYKGKNGLKKMTDTLPVTLTNYEEWFLSYIDNELSATDQLNVEQFLFQNPSLQKEFSLLQKTKLPAEEVVFTDKATLYKTGEKGRVIPIRWWRAAAAIFLIGIGFVTYSVLTKKSTSGNEMVNTEGQNNNKENKILPGKEKNIPAENALAIEDKQQNKAALPVQANPGKKTPASPAIATVTKKSLLEEKKNKFSPDDHKKDEPVVVTNNLPTPENNPNLKIPVENDALAINDIQKGNVNPMTSLRNDVTNKTPLPSNIRQASFKDDAIFDRDEKKNKLRGFFRKITRTLEKRTDIDATDEDGKLLVAGLAIKLK